MSCEPRKPVSKQTVIVDANCDVRAAEIPHTRPEALVPYFQPTPKLEKGTILLTSLKGVIAAMVTPLDHNGQVNLEAVPSMIDALLVEGIVGLYICGSTGEGMSLTTKERCALAERVVSHSSGRVPVLVQVGHNSLNEAQALARHAESIGADAISATCPSYFKVESEQTLSECMSAIASAAPRTPFYYYHIPVLTGSALHMPKFLEMASLAIPNFSGLKFTSPELHLWQQCQTVNPEYQVFWGKDEMFLPALATGARAFIGSTYNLIAPIYGKIQSAFEDGDFESARKLQLRAISTVDLLARFPFLAALKFAIGRKLNCAIGGCRLPMLNLTRDQETELERELSEAQILAAP